MFSMGLITVVILLALCFDYINGFHDTANAIATSVSTKALSPRNAIIVAASFNFLGALSGTAVASTIGKGIVDPQLVTPLVIIAALIGAISWNVFTWFAGIPSSSSHALIGGLSGAVIAEFGWMQLNWEGIIKILIGLIASPVIAILAGLMIMTLLFWLFQNAVPLKINTVFRRLQVLSACMASFAHGSNDAQKSMGIITMVLVGGGMLASFEVPFWVKIACAGAMGLGTAMGGWKIIKTVGGKIFKIEPINGFAADFAASTVIYSASLLGAPVSTTHVVSSSIMGVGVAKRLRGVRWNIAQQIIIAWAITIPASAIIAFIIYQTVFFLFYTK